MSASTEMSASAKMSVETPAATSASAEMSACAEMSSQTPASFQFLPSQFKILEDNMAAIQMEDRKKDRQKLIKTVRKQILHLPESKALPLEQREDLKIAVDTWFSRKTRRRSQKIKFGKTWTARLTMYEEHKESVNKLKAEMFKMAKAKGKRKRTPFDNFQQALTIHWERLSKDEQDRYKALADKWNSEGVSKEKKREAASKLAITYIRKFAEDMYKSMGVRFLFITALESPEGTIETGVMDFNDSIGGGMAYTTVNPNWHLEGIDIDSWNAHCKDYYNPEQGTHVRHKKLPRKHLKFEENEYGEPILPDPLHVPRRQNARTWRQAVVRGFVSRHYELASGLPRAIPWRKFIPHARECIDEVYLPADLLETFAEPSTMRDNQCHQLLSFWYNRQQAGDSPTFRFSHYVGSQEELFPAKPLEIIQDRSEGKESQDDAESQMEQEHSHTNEDKERKRAEKGGKGGKDSQKRKGKQKATGKGKGKGKAIQDEDDTSAESSEDSSSSDEPKLDSSDEDSEEELEFDWGVLYDKEKAAREGSSQMGAGSGQSTSREIPAESVSLEASAESSGGIGEGSGQSMIGEISSESAGRQVSTLSSMIVPPQEATLPADPAEAQIKSQGLAFGPLEAISQIFNNDPNAGRLLLEALSALQVNSQPPSPVKGSFPQSSNTQQPERKRARSSTPPTILESPTKKSKELHPEHSQVDEIPDIPGPSSSPPPISADNIPDQALEPRGARTRGARGALAKAGSSRGTIQTSRVTTRSQIKLEKRETRSKR